MKHLREDEQQWLESIPAEISNLRLQAESRLLIALERLSEARAELAAAKQDTELLEWLFKYTATIHHTGSTQEPFWISWQSQHYRQRNRTACWATAREALYSAIIAQSDADAAMSSSQPSAQEKESQS